MQSKQFIIMLIFMLGVSALQAVTFGDYEYEIRENGTCFIYDYTGTNTIVTIPREIEGHSVVGLYEESFRYSDSLVTVNIPTSVSNIYRLSFSECTNLKNINIPNSVSTISEYCFYKCTNLSTIELPDSINSLGLQSFRECTSLSEVRLGNGLKTLSNFSFYKCNKLGKINIPESVTGIGIGCFSETGLTNLTFWCDAPQGIDLAGTLDSNCQIYYDEGKTGFTTPVWQGYACYPIPEPTSLLFLGFLSLMFFKHHLKITT